jgi:hypothetical protein
MYPKLDAEISAYRAALAYDGVLAPLVLPGAHEEFPAAAARARKIAEALRAVGETGLAPHVTFSGERPAGFPRNGVRA